MVHYTCEKCYKKYNFDKHIKIKKPCLSDNILEKDDVIQKQTELIEEQKKLFDKEKQKQLDLLEDKDKLIEQKNLIIHDIELLIREKDKQLDKYIAKTGKIINNNVSTTTTNNTINLTDLGGENVKKLSLKEKVEVLNSGHQCYLKIINAIHNNKRFPEYNNIAIKNLRAAGGHEFQCGIIKV
jgi:hypothetical protein